MSESRVLAETLSALRVWHDSAKDLDVRRILWDQIAEVLFELAEIWEQDHR